METKNSLAIVLPGFSVLCVGVMAAVGMLAQQPGLVDTGKPTFTTFDAPGAGTGSGYATYPASVDNAGAVAGFYFDANGVVHGFLPTRRI
jgi:hypothetical protein